MGVDQEAYDILKEEVLSQESDKDAQHHIIELSVTENVGVEELKVQVKRMLGDVRIVLDAMANDI